MDINIVKNCSEQSLAGTITFPEAVKNLIVTGVERYNADLIELKKTYYSVNGETYSDAITINGPRVAVNFDANEIKSAIADSQQNRIDYKTFLNLAMLAGCIRYEVFLTGKKAIYFGRDGSQHIEHFPGAKQ
jgi:uncharacterized protein YbcV (DUF1398 family)